MRGKQRGFTLIELMITVAILGILVAVAVPTYIAFVNRGKKVEAAIALDKVTKNVRIYHFTNHVLPPTTTLMPTTRACDTGTGKTAPTTQNDWYSDPGWKAIEFYLDDPSYYQYQWHNFTTDGLAWAQADVDCDGIPGFRIVQMSITSGDLLETLIVDIAE